MRLKTNPTLIGTIAILVWGLSLSVNRLIATQIGIPALAGTVFAITGTLGLMSHKYRGQKFPEGDVFKNPLVYVRWISFALNPICVWTAAVIVQKSHLPFVILINYLWPTAIILFSILIAGVKVTRPIFFVTGTVIVVAAISIEILQPDTLTGDMFSVGRDNLAYMLAFTSAVAWGFYTALTRRVGHITGGAALIPIFQLTLGLALPFSFLPNLYQWDHLTISTAILLVCWSVLQFFAFLTWDFATREGNVVILSLCADFIPWLSLAAAHAILGVDIGNKTLLSALCLVAGAMITRYGTLKKRIEEKQLEELACEHSQAD